jgi:ribosomal 50S subunit-associated protein YjgA (DUF615 family)
VVEAFQEEGDDALGAFMQAYPEADGVDTPVADAHQEE